MNNKQYLDALKKALGRLHKQRREEILAEIRSHLEDAGDTQGSLLERFGDPKVLADQYLEGEDIAPAVTDKLKMAGKKIALITGSMTIGLIIMVCLLVGYFSSDDFDYSDESASELTENRNLWNTVTAPSDIHITLDQAKAVFYWHAKSTIEWKCDGDISTSDFEKNPIKIRHSSCLIYLPNQSAEIKSDPGENCSCSTTR